MNIYYTAKDIEELAAKGIRQLKIGSGVTLTDFARETAQQLDIALIKSGEQVSPSTPPASPSNASTISSKYNKPTGCQHASNSLPAAQARTAVPADQSMEGANSSTVNRLIDLMGKAIKRGG
jgi:hypothetical protein